MTETELHYKKELEQARETIEKYQAFFQFFNKELKPLQQKWDYLQTGNRYNV